MSVDTKQVVRLNRPAAAVTAAHYHTWMFTVNPSWCTWTSQAGTQQHKDTLKCKWEQYKVSAGVELKPDGSDPESVRHPAADWISSTSRDKDTVLIREFSLQRRAVWSRRCRLTSVWTLCRSKSLLSSFISFVFIYLSIILEFQCFTRNLQFIKMMFWTTFLIFYLER